MAVRFEGYERRIDKINACLKEYGIKDLEEATHFQILCLWIYGSSKQRAFRDHRYKNPLTVIP